MRRLILAGLVSMVVPGCASNKAADDPGLRIWDTTPTVRNTANPNDSLACMRDGVPGVTRLVLDD
jgi:hypothetical protein